MMKNRHFSMWDGVNIVQVVALKVIKALVIVWGKRSFYCFTFSEDEFSKSFLQLAKIGLSEALF